VRLRLPPTVVFGAGSLGELPRVLAELGVARPLIVTDAGVAAVGLPARVVRQLAVMGITAHCWDGVVSDPDEGQAELCCSQAAMAGCDGIVALGGGSVIDAAKVGAVLATNGGRTRDYFGFDRVPRRGLPVVAVPTTPGSGSEVSSHAVLVRREPRRTKEVVAGVHLLASAALIDPELAATLPRRETVCSALDSLFHAIEAFVARRATPLSDAFARLAVPQIATALPRVIGATGPEADGPDADGPEVSGRDAAAARESLALGCLYANLAMANANAGVIHALGYPLTGRFGIPHGLANALVGVAALESTWRGRPERYAELARLLGGGGAPAETAAPVETAAAAGREVAEAASLGQLVGRLLAAVGVQDRLADWAVGQADLPRLAVEASRFRPVLENTPASLDEGALLAIYRAALAAPAAAPIL